MVELTVESTDLLLVARWAVLKDDLTVEQSVERMAVWKVDLTV